MRHGCVLGCVLFLAAILLPALAFSTAGAADGPPNILLIMADDVGTETLGCYGGTSYKTPRLDALASGGLRMTQGHSMPVCHPTRICLLTGRYPFRLGNPGWGSFPKSEEQHTVANALKQAGYATAIAGKWQLTLLKNDPEHPHRLGFDEYSVFGWHEGPRYWQPLIWQNGEIRDDVKDRYGPEVYVDFLIDFMKKHRDGPFFAFYSMALCHDVTDDLKQPVPYAPGKDHYDTYSTMIENMDREAGRLIAALDDLKLRENTVVIFTADNGTSKSYIHAAEEGKKKFIRKPVVSNQGDRKIPGGKGTLLDAGTNVPLLISWQGKIQGGQVLDHLVDFSDFYATFIELAGAKAPSGVKLDGHSFAPLLLEKEFRPRAVAFAEHGGKSWVRTKQYKLYSDGRLIHMPDNPQEKNPIAPDKASPAAKAAREKLAAALQELGVRDRSK